MGESNCIEESKLAYGDWLRVTNNLQNLKVISGHSSRASSSSLLGQRITRLMSEIRARLDNDKDKGLLGNSLNQAFGHGICLPSIMERSIVIVDTQNVSSKLSKLLNLIYRIELEFYKIIFQNDMWYFN